MSVRRNIEPPELSIQRCNRIQSKVIKWGGNNYDDFPWRSGDNPSRSLIAEVMLQRTRAEQVIPVYLSLWDALPSIEDAAVNSEKVKKILSPLGLRWRIEKIVQLIDELAQRGGEIPDDRKELLQLPGVGEYIANAYLSLYRGIKAPINDNNAVRVWGRVFNLKTDPETSKKKWFTEFVQQITPDKNFRKFNLAVLDLARKVCKKRPLCPICPIKSECHYYKECYQEPLS